MSNCKPSLLKPKPLWQQWQVWLGIFIVVGIVVGFKTARNCQIGKDLPILSYSVKHTLEHDPEAFSQGLVFYEGQLFESTGQFGKSTLRELNPESGAVIKEVHLANDLFGEGIAINDDLIYQLTWKNNIVIVYNFNLEEVKRLKWKRQGWGLTHDGKQFIVSDGSSRLFFVDPRSFQETAKIDVALNGRKVKGLNELEFVDGYVYANIWQKRHQNEVYKIDPKNGTVVGKIDLSALYPQSERSHSAAVLNGIAYDEDRKIWLFTGKDWPNIFELSVGE